MIDFFSPDDFKIKFKGKWGQRRCVRVSHPQLKILLNSEKEYPVKDINTYGVAFKCKDCGYLPGDICSLSIVYKGEEILKDIKAKVKRLAQDTVCCEFVDLGRQEEYTLDKLVLAIQKEEIKKKKLTKEE